MFFQNELALDPYMSKLYAPMNRWVESAYEAERWQVKGFDRSSKKWAYLHQESIAGLVGFNEGLVAALRETKPLAVAPKGGFFKRTVKLTPAEEAAQIAEKQSIIDKTADFLAFHAYTMRSDSIRPFLIYPPLDKDRINDQFFGRTAGTDANGSQGLIESDGFAYDIGCSFVRALAKAHKEGGLKDPALVAASIMAFQLHVDLLYNAKIWNPWRREGAYLHFQTSREKAPAAFAAIRQSFAPFARGQDTSEAAFRDAANWIVPELLWAEMGMGQARARAQNVDEAYKFATEKYASLFVHKRTLEPFAYRVATQTRALGRALRQMDPSGRQGDSKAMGEAIKNYARAAEGVLDFVQGCYDIRAEGKDIWIPLMDKELALIEAQRPLYEAKGKPAPWTQPWV